MPETSCGYACVSRPITPDWSTGRVVIPEQPAESVLVGFVERVGDAVEVAGVAEVGDHRRDVVGLRISHRVAQTPLTLWLTVVSDAGGGPASPTPLPLCPSGVASRLGYRYRASSYDVTENVTGQIARIGERPSQVQRKDLRHCCRAAGAPGTMRDAPLEVHPSSLGQGRHGWRSRIRYISKAK